MAEPKILLLDEPLSALDNAARLELQSELKEMQKLWGIPFILVTHDLGVVANFADRIQVMYAGQIMEAGTTKEIFNNPRHPYTWALLRSIPRLDSKDKEDLYSLKGTPPDLILPLKGCPFADRCDYAMEICREGQFEKQTSDTHKTWCWLEHPDAPKVERPV